MFGWRFPVMQKYAIMVSGKVLHCLTGGKAVFTPRYQNEQTDRLADALLALETKEEIYRFLEDVLTIQEMKSITQRLEVAVMLREKETYQEIVRKTGASTTTIGRVNRALQYGADGYDIVLSRLPDVTDAPQK